MNKNNEDRKVSPSDQVLYASMIAVQTIGAIQQAHIDGQIDLETYRKLYALARQTWQAIESVNTQLEQL